MSVAETIYKRLDEFTGGIEDFLTNKADEVYESVYEPFHMTVMDGRALTFGFYREMGGDLCPDPEFCLTLGSGEAVLDSLVTTTVLGSVYFGGGEGNGDYCAEFLEEMATRKKNGGMTLKDRVTYP